MAHSLTELAVLHLKQMHPAAHFRAACIVRVHDAAGDNAACCAQCLPFCQNCPCLVVLGAGFQRIQFRSSDSSGNAHVRNHSSGGECTINVSWEQSLGMQGHEEQGRPLLERALVIQEATLGPDHPDVQAIRDVLEGED